jgi:hypothetical protein
MYVCMYVCGSMHARRLVATHETERVMYVWVSINSYEQLQAVRGLGMLSDALSSGDGGMVSVALAGLSLIDPLLSARIDDVRAEANLLREARKTQQERQLHLARPPPLQRSSTGGRIDSLSQQTAMT